MIEKIKAEIERLITKHSGKEGCDEAAIELDNLLSFIESLEEERPHGLDDAAEEYAQEEMMGGLAERAFKAGAKWMAEQGWHEEAIIKGSNDVVWLNYNVELPIDLAKFFKDGDKVIVQIRKKEE